MAHEVIMPALGMAQESGVIVSWLKSPGDAVKSGEALMEVETDKAVMEVEAQADGFLTDVRASEGDDVPVGEVIALISDSAEASGSAAAPSPKPNGSARDDSATKQAPAEQAAPEPPQDAEAAKAPRVPSGQGHAAGDRILASPKAKRIAREQGLDLRRLVTAGRPQPYRAVDVENLSRMAEPSSARPTATTARATLPEAAYRAFLDLLASEGDIPAQNLIAAFAAGALRSADDRASVSVQVVTPRLGQRSFIDPDLGRISEIEAAGEALPDIMVLDLTQSRITQVTLSATDLPVISIGREGDNIVLSIAALPKHLDDVALIACLDDLAGRFEDPLRHLL